MSELKPCPFCRGEAKIEKTDEHYMAICGNDDCKAIASTVETTREKAIISWNHRPIEDKLKADKQELLEAYKELLSEAKYLFDYYPSRHTHPIEEYFSEEDNLIARMEQEGVKE